MSEPHYKRILLKVSGEALAGDASRGLETKPHSIKIDGLLMLAKK